MAHRARKSVIKTEKVSGEVAGNRYFPQAEATMQVEFPPSQEGKEWALSLLGLAYLDLRNQLLNYEPLDKDKS